jgi:multiple sugar transport system substrate-binding protein
MTRKTFGVSFVAALALLLGLCSGCGGSSKSGDNTLVFWTQLNTPDRLAKQVAVAKQFTAKTHIKVKVVGLAATDESQSIASQVASGKVPDVVQSNLDQITTWNGQGLIESGAADAVLDKLGRSTFNAGALKLVTTGGKALAVPADGWGQMLFYRKDLFAKARLQPPTSLDELVRDARQLKTSKMAGIVLGTKPADGFTDQTLEWLALTNGCELVKPNTAKDVTLNTPQCQHVYAAYEQLIASSVNGAQDVMTTRAAYLAGQAAMISWSPHILDEMAGLDPDFPPTCAQCKKDSGFLGKNTGIITDIHGPDVAQGKQYGITLNLSIMHGDHVEQAKKFVQYLLSDGYADYLSAAPEGRYPLRNGTTARPDGYTTMWSNLPVGVNPKDRKGLRTLYGDQFLAAVKKGATSFARWGYASGGAKLVSAAITAHALGDGEQAIADNKSPERVGQIFQNSVEGVAKSLK